MGVGFFWSEPAKLLRIGPARSEVRGLDRISWKADVGLAVGLFFVDPVDSESLPVSWRGFESQQTDPRSQRFGGQLMTTEGLEQKAAINPGRHTPGHRFKGPSVVVVVATVVVAFGVVVTGRGVVVDGRLVAGF